MTEQNEEAITRLNIAALKAGHVLPKDIKRGSCCPRRSPRKTPSNFTFSIESIANCVAAQRQSEPEEMGDKSNDGAGPKKPEYVPQKNKRIRNRGLYYR